MDILELAPKDYHAKLTVNRENIRDENSFLSKSVVWELDRDSLWKWRNYAKRPAPTSAMSWGSLVDVLALTPELESSELTISPYDSFRTKEAQQWKLAQEAEKKVIVDAATLEEGRKAAKMLTETCKASAALLKGARSQVIVAGRILGCKAKGLVDILPEEPETLADLKTTADFSLEGFAKSTARYGYAVQGAWYLNLWNAMHPDQPKTKFKIVWQSSEPPYEACVSELSPVDLENGWAYASVLIQRILTATDTGVWPMFGEGQEIITTVPTWSAMQQEQKITG